MSAPIHTFGALLKTGEGPKTVLFKLYYDELYQTRGSYGYDTEEETKAAEDEEIAKLESGESVVLIAEVWYKCPGPHCIACGDYAYEDSLCGIVIDNREATWAASDMPGSLQQPALRLPFRAGYIWAYTGGPHTGWGSGQPFAAVDFAPASDTSGCYTGSGDLFATSMVDGLVVRSDIDGIIIDLDKDGDERTGWVLFYLHLATDRRVGVGQEVKAGDPVRLSIL